MYDKDLIQRVCNLTCSKEDVVRSQTTIAYDKLQPFRKYYNVEAIKGALEKFASDEWDDQTLAHWACIYCWILSGGFGDNVKEDLDTFEGFFRDVVTWDLDGLSFFDADCEEDPIKYICGIILIFENYDHIWQTREEWHAVYAMIGPNDEFNGAQWVLLINDRNKEYMILYTDCLENGYEDEFFKFLKDTEFILRVENLKSAGYTALTGDEEYYYCEIEELL